MKIRPLQKHPDFTKNVCHKDVREQPLMDGNFFSQSPTHIPWDAQEEILRHSKVLQKVHTQHLFFGIGGM
jgi:hypothetical protein